MDLDEYIYRLKCGDVNLECENEECINGWIPQTHSQARIPSHEGNAGKWCRVVVCPQCSEREKQKEEGEMI